MIRKEFNYNIFKTYLPAFIGLVVFLFLGIPENLSGADDAYSFARLIRDEDISRLILPRYALFLPLSKIGYDFLGLIGIHIDAYLYLTIQSVYAGSLAVLLVHYLCYFLLDFGRIQSLGIALLLLFSWAFLRYSVEAELYTPSITLLLIYLILIIRLSKIDQITYNQLVIISITGSLAILFYKPNAVPVLVCLPFILYAKRDTFRWTWRLSAMTFFFTIGSFLILSLVSARFGFSEFIFGGASLTPGRWLSSVMVVSSNLVSFLWIFGIPGAEKWTELIWPNKVLSEEIFLQEAALLPSWIILMLVLALIIFIVFRFIKNYRYILSLLKCTWVRVLIWWIVAYAAMLIYFDPSSSEPWIMIQLPVILLLGAVLLKESGKRSSRILSCAIVLLFFSINLLGGLLLIRDKSYDYIYLRGRNIPDKVSDNDIIMTFGPKTMEEYLAYQYRARIINLEENFETGLELLKRGGDSGRIILLDDVFRPDKAIIYRMKEDTGLPAKMVQENYILDTLHYQNQFSIYELRKRVK